MSNASLVPSVDALRALRRLAYASPAAVIGAAGALCGTVAIHYHQVQKIHKVEQILAAKRKLHSISRRSGSTRLAYMIEAAEKGEDFTIDRTRHSPRTSSQRRPTSVLHTNQQHAGSQKYFDYDVGKETGDTGARNFGIESMRPESNSAQGHEVSLSKNEIKLGDSQSAVLLPHVALFDSQPRKSYRRLSLWNGSPTEAKRRVKGLYSQPLNDVPGIMTRWDVLPQETKIVQAISDLNPLRQSLPDLGVAPNNSAQPADTRSDGYPSLPDVPNGFTTNALSMLQPWQSVTKETNAILPGGNIVESPNTPATKPDLYIALAAQSPTVSPTHSVKSRYDLLDDKVKESFSGIGAERYLYVFTSIINLWHSRGRKDALRLLEETMCVYTETGDKADFGLAQTLYVDCTRLFSTSEMKPIVWRYVERFLKGDMPRLEVVSFLYPRCGTASRDREQQHYYFFAHQYLENIVAAGGSCDGQITELRKVLTGTQSCLVQPHEHLIVPVLRSLCAAGQMTLAQALFDEMTTNYKIHPTMYSIRILVVGYGKLGKWSKVKSILDDNYRRGWSQEKAYATSYLLISVFDDYSHSRRPENVVAFVKRCLEDYRLQPLSGMTRSIICLSLRHRRYDLVVDWIDMVRTRYPHVEIGTGSAAFAFDVSCIWSETDASVEDILQGCKAIASHAIRDPFSKVFRNIMSEAVSRHLSPRFTKLAEELNIDASVLPHHWLDQFSASLKSLKRQATISVPNSRIRLALSDMVNQEAALRSLRAVCRGQLESADSKAQLVPVDHVYADESEREVAIPRLTSLSELVASVLHNYVQRDKLNLSIDHQYLYDTALKLAQQSRRAHAFNLIQAVYESKWARSPSGVEFDLGLFTQWLKLAWQLRSGENLRTVLWAILDAGSQLEVTGQLILLARIAAPKTHLQRVKSARDHEIDEVEYLRIRLRRRRWMTERSEAKLQFDNWQGLSSSYEE